jgi:phosphatidylglycerophosphatase A
MSDRRALDWKKVRSPSARLAVLTGTWFGSGLLPVMPGTWGTMAAMPLAWWVAPAPIAAKLVVWLALLAAGTWAAKKFHDLFGVADNQNIVVDEVVGLGLTALTLAREDWKGWIAAFVVFRLFDVIKLPPVRAVDVWSKGSDASPASGWRAGFGVMADDVLAGLQGLLVIAVLARYFG